MIRALALLALAYVGAVLDGTAAAGLSVGFVAPDFVLLTGLIWMRHSTSSYDFLALGLVGLLGDLTGHGPLGWGAAAYIVAGYFFSRESGSEAQRGGGSGVLRLMAAALTIELGRAAVTAVRLGGGSWPLLLIQAAGAALYTSAIALVLSAALTRDRSDLASAGAW